MNLTTELYMSYMIQSNAIIINEKYFLCTLAMKLHII